MLIIDDLGKLITVSLCVFSTGLQNFNTVYIYEVICVWLISYNGDHTFLNFFRMLINSVSTGQWERQFWVDVASMSIIVYD